MSETKSVVPASFARYERRQKQRELEQEKKKQGESYPRTATLPNRKSGWKTVEEEQEAIQTTTEEKLKVYQQLLPGLLTKLQRIPDPRQLRKTKHRMTVNAMKGYHYLMHIVRMLNELALHSISLSDHVREVGVQSFITKFRIAMRHIMLNTGRICRLVESSHQLRLVWDENWKKAAS